MIGKLLTAIGNKLMYLLGTIWGKILLIVAWIIEFVGGYELAIWSVVVAITLDLIWGVWASIVRGKFAKSELVGREVYAKYGESGTTGGYAEEPYVARKEN